MNKTQLVEALSAHFDGNRRAAAHALDSVVDTVTREVAKGQKVAITGFGAFEKVIRPARMVRNPATGERVRAKKTAVARFRPGTELKAIMAGAKKAPKVTPDTVRSSTPSRSTGTSAAKKSTAKKSTAKKSAAKKSTTKRSTAKKAPAKKSTAKRSTAKKSAAKKSPAKRSTAKKTSAARTSTGRRSTTAKAPAKRSTATRSARKG